MRKHIVILSLVLCCLCFVCCGSGYLQSKENAAEADQEAVLQETNYVIATCTNEKCIVLYDLDTYDGENLDNCEIWYFAPEIQENYQSGGISGVKYREDTIFGDVVILCAGNGYAAIISYPDGKVLWEVFDSGENAHAIEILPSGNVAVAASNGSTLRVFASCAVLQNDAEAAFTYREYPLKGGHGVLWDPEYEVLWALGSTQLQAYTIAGEGKDETLAFRADLGCEKQSLDGHDLSADFSDSDYLWVTGKDHVFRFEKETGELLTAYDFCDKLDKPYIKGFGNNPSGSYFQTMPNYGMGTSWEKESYAGWSTDRIYFYHMNEDKTDLETIKCKSNTRAFYKVFSFYGKYQ